MPRHKEKMQLGRADGKPFTIPAWYVTETAAILGKRGSGKSYLGNVIAEELLDCHQQVVIIDPTSSWWGLRSSADGKHEGYPILIFGEDHADLPLDDVAGPKIAELVVENPGLSVILSLDHLSKTSQRKFVMGFSETLYHLKHGRGKQTPLHIFIDEADLFCLSKDTEILTPNGWKTYREISVGDEVSCFDPKTGRYSFQPIERLIVQNYDGDMIYLKTENLDCLVTPDHRVLLRRVQRAKGRRKKHYPWTFVPASKMAQQTHIPYGGAPCGKGLLPESDDFWRIMGWVITDGCIHSKRDTNWSLCIEQSVGTHKLGQNISDIMGSILSSYDGVTQYSRTRKPVKIMDQPKKSKPQKSIRWYLGRKLSASLLVFLGNDIHRIPRTILQHASESQLRALFTGLLEGDGTSQDGRHWACLYVGHNEALADDFQELCVRLGVRSSKKYVKQLDQWTVRLQTTKTDHYVRKPKTKRYAGIVWDVTVPTGAFVVRRNGTVFTTGNCPQKVIHGMERLVGTINDLVRRGRKYGIGVTLLTQRPAVINKDVLSQAEILIAGQVTGKHDRDAIRDWIRYNADEVRLKEFLTSLALLQRGTLWVWSPGRLKVLVQLQVRKRRTFDSSATPEFKGTKQKSAEPKRMSRVELKQVRSSLESLVKRSEENDPKALKREVARLRKELGQAQKQPKGKAPVKATPARPPVDGARVARRVEQLYNNYLFNRASAKVTDLIAALKAKIGSTIRSSSLDSIEAGVVREIERTAKSLERELGKPIKVPDLLKQAGVIPSGKEKPQGRTVAPPVSRFPVNPKKPAAPQVGVSGVRLAKCGRAVLTVLAQHGKSCSKRLVALHAGYSIKSGSFSNSLSSLRTAGLIVGSGAGPVEITEQGLAVVGDYEPLPSGEELIEHWLRMLGKCESAILRTVVEAHPEPLMKEDIAERAGYIVTSGSFSNAISKLRGLELIQGKGREPIGISEEVFE